MKIFKTMFLLGALLNSECLMAAQVNFGERSRVTGSNAAAFGYLTEANGESSVVFGEGSLVFDSGHGAAAFGFYTQARGKGSVAFGFGSRAFGSGSAAFGDESYSLGRLSAAFGHSKSVGNFSFSTGSFTTANAIGSFVTGRGNLRYDDVDPDVEKITDPLFVVGNGSGRPGYGSNAFTVFANGLTTVYGDLVVNGRISQSSDERLKKDINPLSYGIDEITALQTVSYKLKSDGENKTHLGLIAQDVELILPELVGEGRDGYKSLDYGKLTVVLVEAIKDLKSDYINLQRESSETIKEIQREHRELVKKVQRENELLINLLCHDRENKSICKR
ncbi:MAG: tail fiber domain-containing protein [Exilibacterium sp.]